MIKFNEPFITGNELTYIQKVFENKHFQGNGEFTKKSQSMLEEYLGAPKVLLTDSCTSALEIAALLLKETTDDEVILPSYTFSSTASAFARAGYRLRFADIETPSMMISASTIEPLINEHTRVIVPIHYAGFPCGIEAIRQLALKHNIHLVEDAAQALGTRLNGKSMGTYGRLGCLSFHETKNLHAGLSGALIINDESLNERATYIWERGTNRQAVLNSLADKYTWVELGGSFYPTELQAAFLTAQLQAITENMEHRKSLWESYFSLLSPLKERYGIDFPTVADNVEINYHAFFVVFDSFEQCQAVRKHLLENDVHAYIGYVPLHSSPVGKEMGFSNEDVPLTQKYSERVLRMPMHNNLNEGQINHVCNLVKEKLIGRP